jgi:hypothetical protein
LAWRRPVEFRSIDGSGNNLAQAGLYAAGSAFISTVLIIDRCGTPANPPPLAEECQGGGQPTGQYHGSLV